MLLLVKFFEIDFVFEVDVLELCFDGICNLSFKLRLCLGLSNDFFFIYGLINEFLFFLFVSVLIRLCSFFVFRQQYVIFELRGQMIIGQICFNRVIMS